MSFASNENASRIACLMEDPHIDDDPTSAPLSNGNDFLLTNDRIVLPSTLYLMEWCPSMDLVALVPAGSSATTSATTASSSASDSACGSSIIWVHRFLSWQRLFALNLNNSSEKNPNSTETSIKSLMWSPDGNLFEISMDDSKIEELPFYYRNYNSYCLIFFLLLLLLFYSPSPGRVLACGTTNGILHLISVENGQVVYSTTTNNLLSSMSITSLVWVQEQLVSPLEPRRSNKV